jgi:hypothetical protein
MNRMLVSLFLAAPVIPISTTGMAQEQFDGRTCSGQRPTTPSPGRDHREALGAFGFRHMDHCGEHGLLGTVEASKWS